MHDELVVAAATSVTAGVCVCVRPVVSLYALP